MESESKLVTGTNNITVDIQIGSTRSVDVGTNNPNLEVKISNEGPSNNVIISATARRNELRAGQQSTFKLGDLTNRSVVTLQNDGGQPAKVQISW